MAKPRNFVTKLPETEHSEVQMPYPSGNLYFITRKQATNTRTLWKKTESGYERLLSGDSPNPLYDYVAAAEKGSR